MMAAITQSTLHVDAAQPRAAGITPEAARAAQAAPPQADASQLQGVSLVDVSASLGSGRNLVADYVMSADNHLAEIRVIDSTTHEVIAESPPDSIAQIQQEMLAYQGVASRSRTSGDT